MEREIPFVLIGLGNIGRNLLDILVHRQAVIAADYGIRFRLVGAADSSGAAIDEAGLDMERLVAIKLAKGGCAAYPGAGRPRVSALEMMQSVKAEILVDASPTNLRDGEPGMSCVRAALAQGQHTVMANKGPLVLAFGELTDAAAEAGVTLAYSGTVAGGLPTVNIGVRDLAGSGVTRVEGIFNGTTNYILTRMATEQISYTEALSGAQRAGIAEADPTLDVDGWDAANKLVIIANSVLRRPISLSDVAVQGIRQVTLDDLLEAQAQGRVIKPLAVAEWDGAGYRYSVGPVWLERSHPLAQARMWDMGVVYYTDYMGAITAIIEEEGPVPTSAAVLRDMINLYR